MAPLCVHPRRVRDQRLVKGIYLSSQLCAIAIESDETFGNDQW
jgi:hypothetical protein